jgi:hypothetical protein
MHTLPGLRRENINMPLQADTFDYAKLLRMEIFKSVSIIIALDCFDTRVSPEK